jgi:hypothetical protein
MPLVLAGATSGQATVQATDAQTVTLTLPATSGTLVTTGGAQTIEFADGSASAPSITNSGDTNTGIFFPVADAIAFSEGGTESMRITSDGNLGIGTAAPAARIHAVTTSGSTTNPVGRFEAAIGSYTGTSLVAANTLGDSSTYNLLSCLTDSDGDGGGPFTKFLVRGDGNVGIGTSSPTVKLAVADTTGSCLIRAFGDASGTTVTAQLGASSSGLVAVGAVSNHPLVFATNDAERARINTSGALLVGKTVITATPDGLILSPNGNTLCSLPNSVSDTLNVFNTTAGVYRFYVTSGGTVFATNTTISAISDARLKENIQDIDVGLDAVMALKPRKFDWKAGKGKNIKGDRGWIAQEFETVFPEMINEWKDPAPKGEESYKSVAADLIPVLVKAIQEQQAIITDLKARIETLENT